MLKSSKSIFEELKELEGNFKRGNKKDIKELNERTALDESYEEFFSKYIENKEIEEEADKKLIENIKKHFNVKDEKIIIFMPQFIFAKNLRIILEDRKINQKQFEEDNELGEKMLSKYKNGHQFPDLTVMCKIAYGLDMTIYQLLDMSKFTSLPVQEINQITGLSEGAMRILFKLQHNTNEDVELTNNTPISKVNKAKLDIFNSFIEDNVNFLDFLKCLEQYSRLKAKQEKVKVHDEEEVKEEIKKNNSEIRLQLLGLKGELFSILQKFLIKLNNRKGESEK